MKAQAWLCLQGPPFNPASMVSGCGWVTVEASTRPYPQPRGAEAELGGAEGKPRARTLSLSASPSGCLHSSPCSQVARSVDTVQVQVAQDRPLLSVHKGGPAWKGWGAGLLCLGYMGGWDLGLREQKGIPCGGGWGRG